MANSNPAPVVPNGKYRICSADRSPELYLEAQTGGRVEATSLNKDSNRQEWTITAQDGDTYLIEDFEGKTSMCVERDIKPPVVSTGKTQRWTLEPRGDEFIIGVLEDNTCMDLSTDGWAIIWQRRSPELIRERAPERGRGRKPGGGIGRKSLQVPYSIRK